MPRKTLKNIRPLTGQSRDFLQIVLPAASSGNLAAVKRYLEQQPAYVHQVGPHGRTMLWEAARGGKLAMVKYLVEAGGDVERRGCYFRETAVELSPWCIAVVRNHADVAEFLQDQGALYTLDAACYLGDLPFVEDALRAAPERANRCIEPVSDPEGLMPVHYAVAGGKSAVLEVLCKFGCDVRDDGGRLASWALGLNSCDILERLLRAGAVPRPGDINEACDDPAWSALLAEYGYSFDVNAPDRLGFPPLVEACRGNHNEAERTHRIADLLSRGAQVNIRDHKGKTPLHRAAQAGFIESMNTLLAAGADIEATDDKKETPLFDAVRAGRAQAVEQLLSCGANRDHCNGLNQTAGLLASRSSKAEAEAIRHLLDAL